MVRITSTWSNLSDHSTSSAAFIATDWLTTGSDDELQLFCWVPGKSNKPFPVNIGAGKTVGNLKNVIKKAKEPTFAEINAGALDLWKVG